MMHELVLLRCVEAIDHQCYLSWRQQVSLLELLVEETKLAASDVWSIEVWKQVVRVPEAKFRVILDNHQREQVKRMFAMMHSQLRWNSRIWWKK